MLFKPKLAVALIATTGLIACGGDSPTGGTTPEDTLCTIDVNLLWDGGVGRDGIPSLTNPTFVEAGHEDASYLRPDDRVIGLHLGDEVLAIPHNILWWHEIVNLDRDGHSVAVTYCPLTGTALAFDRAPIGGSELGVSGFLFNNNLVMFDRGGVGGKESLFPQMMGQGVCGPRKNTSLPRLAISEMTWAGWLERHPETQVVSGRTGFSRNYTVFPYGNYEDLDEPPFLPVQYDDERRPKERVVGIEGTFPTVLALPFLELDRLGPLGVVDVEVGELQLVVLWDRAAESGAAFSRFPQDIPGSAGFEANTPVTLRVEAGRILDVETRSEWNSSGQAISGPLAGASLTPHARTMVAFWFAWHVFNPFTRVWVAR